LIDAMLKTLLLACSQPPDTAGPADDTASDDSGTDHSGTDDSGTDDSGTDDGGTDDSGTGACEPEDDGDDLVRVTRTGAFRGAAGPGSTHWLGIPYAAPPVGELRFRPPEPAPCVTKIQDATSWGPLCLQKREKDGELEGEEDCLQLNIWAPSGASGAPVMFFLHGGGNKRGGASTSRSGIALYDGERLAENSGAVVVTVQYRLGALGELVHDALVADDGSAGNYGLLDQIAALVWVGDNIATFGGDPSQLLLFGESAGAVDTCALLASPRATGLFSSAIVQSGGCTMNEWSDALEYGNELLEPLGCTTADCLRAASAEDIVALQSAEVISPSGIVAHDWTPVIDGDVLPEQPETALAGRHNAVPLVVGVDRDEMAIAIPRVGTEVLYQQAMQALELLIDDEQVKVLHALYDEILFPSTRDALIALVSDGELICPARRIATAAAGGQTEPVYRYFYTQVISGYDWLGAAHGMELFYLFGAVGDLQLHAYDAADAGLERSMAERWAAMAATGVPGGGWRAWDESDPYLELATPEATGIGVRTEYCDFWDSIAQ
jgi:para-nitrobenzyl esterase